MTRKFFFFSEMGYNAYPLEALEQYGYSALLFPNSIFDPEKARDLWQMFLREHEYASEMGFDGSVCNEHHNNVLSMQESVNISAAVISQRIKGTIALIGNPLPIHDNPVRVAEEIAMLDLISGGRIISGFVRGTGIEQLSTNANPAYNRERFEEAFALIKKTWTRGQSRSGVPKTPISGAGLERNQVPLSAEITCRFRPKSGAGLLRFLQSFMRPQAL